VGIHRPAISALSSLLLTVLACSSSDEATPAERATAVAADPAGIGALTAHITALDPTPYRAKIERVEVSLDRSGAPSAEQRETVAAALADLATSLEGEKTVLAKALSTELSELADRAAAGLDDAAVRTHWTRIRDGLFTHASWFRGGSETAMR